MRNYKLVISYDGTGYKGWQRLATEECTIQHKLEEAISGVLGYSVTVDGSGRTDSGVHANGQVANVKVAGKLDTESFRQSINEKLPDDICVREISLEKNTFHSRYSAKGKQYIYTIDTREKPDVFQRKFTYHFPEMLDVNNMKLAAQSLIGTYDYSAFCDKKEEKSGVRTIHGINILKEDNLIYIEYYGTGFLNHMVRILTGTLLEVGSGQKEISDVKKALESKKRADAGYTAPARGLRLEQVYYN
ncbi:MAG: tRNA pseudouridine(38-40) synthase TruA [Eubacteriales bacterium]